MNHKTRHDAHKFYEMFLHEAEKKGPDQVVAAMRQLCQHDLYYLLCYVIGARLPAEGEKPTHTKMYQLFNSGPLYRRDWLFERCKEIQNNPNGYIDLWAREHFKTTIITIALTIQDILCDPEITIGVFSFNNKEAKKPYLVIKRELEDNQALKDLFPDILYQNPQEESPKWTEDQGLIAKRKGNPRNATLQAFGLTDGTNPAGSHFMIRVYDDIITEKHVGNPDMIKKALEIWRLSLNCGSIDVVDRYGESDIERYIGTRYHFNDPYREIMEIGAAKPRIYPGTDDGTPTGKPVMFTQKQLDKRRLQGPYQFSCQILQNPVADEAQGFMEEWLQYAMPTREQWHEYNIYLLCDPAGEKKKENDYTVILVIGLGPDGNYYLLDGIRDRLNLTQRTDQVFRLREKYRPLGVGYEKYGKDSDVEHIEYCMNQKNRRFVITKLGGGTGKRDRIKKLIPLFETGRFFIPPVLYFLDYEGKQHDLIKEFKEDEYRAFPVGVHDDILDCMARIVDEKLGAVFPDSLEWNYHQQYPQTGGGYDMLNHSLNQYLGTQQEVRA